MAWHHLLWFKCPHCIKSLFFLIWEKWRIISPLLLSQHLRLQCYTYLLYLHICFIGCDWRPSDKPENQGFGRLSINYLWPSTTTGLGWPRAATHSRPFLCTPSDQYLFCWLDCFAIFLQTSDISWSRLQVTYIDLNWRPGFWHLADWVNIMWPRSRHPG